MNRKVFVIGACVLGLALLLWPVWRREQESNEASAMSSLMAEINQAQEIHYAAHKRYAGHLTDLPTNTFKYNDNGKPEMLNRFVYTVTPDGQQYTLYWQGRYARRMVVNRGEATFERMPETSGD